MTKIARWLRAQCPDCKGKGVIGDPNGDAVGCETCAGSGEA